MLTPDQIFKGNLLRNIRKGSEDYNSFARITVINDRTFAAQYFNKDRVWYYVKSTSAFEMVEP